MMTTFKTSHTLGISGLSLIALISFPAISVHAESLPGPADINQLQPIFPKSYKIEPAPKSVDDSLGPDIRTSKPPANAEQIQFKLLDIQVKGSTVYSSDEIKSLFAKDIGKTVSLNHLWKLSDAITKKYRQDGYFLSRAFIPAQEITDGRVEIRVVEGYIKDVTIDDKAANLPIVRDIVSRIKAEHPISSKKLENFHLLMTDLAGEENLYGTLAPIAGQKDGGVMLIYARNQTPTSSGSISLDNLGSKFLGPTEASIQWGGNLIGDQKTFIAGRTSLPLDELTALNASQTIPLSPETSITLSAGFTHAEPGDTLAAQEIVSQSENLGLSINYKIIRQRLENWSAMVGIDGRNSESTILGSTELSEDKIRALRLGTVYDVYDEFNGYNRLSATLSRGLPALGASRDDSPNISREGAASDFTKLEVDYLRYHSLPYDFGALLSVKGQKASGSLYSSEEFGFGGADLGRAYDSSEITGDDGIAASLELRYTNVLTVLGASLQPYAFYDIGKVWNRNDSQIETVSASSTGLGLRLDHESGLNGSLEAAFPLTKPVDNPIYGDDETAPRINIQLGYKF